MTDPYSESSSNERRHRAPVALQLVARSLGHANNAALLAAAAESDDFEKRDRVMKCLITKYMRLVSAGSALNGLLPVIIDPAEYDRIVGEIRDVEAEKFLCKARYDAIDANLPFNEPPQTAVEALLAAIAQVDRALANTAAVGALLQAVHALVGAYAANSTS